MAITITLGAGNLGLEPGAPGVYTPPLARPVGIGGASKEA
jgi:hypothetical protein